MNERGQASIELLGAVPLLLIAVLACWQALAVGAARETAQTAAHAGALAVMQGRDGSRAARAAARDTSSSRFVVQVRRREVMVRVRPRVVLPVIGSRLWGQATASMGPR